MLKSDYRLLENGKKMKAGRIFRGRFCLLLLLLSVLAGGFRVHVLGYGKSDPDKLYELKRTQHSGFIYRSTWNGENRLVFVSDGFKALADVSELDPVTADELSGGAFVKITRFYVYEPESPRNPGEFDYRKYLLSRGITYCIKIYEDGIEKAGISSGSAFSGIIRWPGATVRRKVREVLSERLGNGPGALTAAIMTGDTGMLDADVKESFRSAGISHLMAVSGMHVTFILLPVRAAVRNKRTGFKARQLLLVFPLMAFITVADFSSPVMRAAITSAFCFISRARERPPDMINAVCLSAAVQIALNPYAVSGTGFILSYASVAALIFIAPGIRRRMTALKYKEKRDVKTIRLLNREALAAGIAVNIVLMPLSLFMFGAVSPVGLIATLYASPVAAGICIGGYALTLLGLCDPVYVLRPFAWIAEYLMKGVCKIISLIATAGSSLGFPLGRITVRRFPVWLLVVYYLAVLALFSPLREKLVSLKERLRRKSSASPAGRTVCILLTAGIMVSVIGLTFARPLIDALVIDVGQGSATFVKADGYAGLIDTGDGRKDVSDVILAQGTERLDFVVLTHGHSDHTGGLEGILEAFPAAFLYVSGDNTPGIENAKQAALDAGWSVVTAGNGDCIRLGRVNMLFTVAEDFFGGRTDADENNASLNVSFSCEYGSLTVTGDLQKEGEDSLYAAGRLSDTDVLVVPHHGSASGSGIKMLSIILPEYAIISVGRKNNYGHPSRETLNRLSDAGAEVFRTDICGGIRITIGRPVFFGRKKVRIWQTLYAEK